MRAGDYFYSVGGYRIFGGLTKPAQFAGVKIHCASSMILFAHSSNLSYSACDFNARGGTAGSSNKTPPFH
jgi:hypothetical protein